MTQAEQEEAVLMVASNPTCGELLQGTGGVRKVRFALGGGGKSGGARIIYFFHSPRMPIYFITVFTKNEKSNLSQAERNALSKLTAALVAAYGVST